MFAPGDHIKLHPNQRKVRIFRELLMVLQFHQLKVANKSVNRLLDRNQITVSGMMITDKCMSCVPGLWWWCVSTSEPKDEKAVNS